MKTTLSHAHFPPPFDPAPPLRFGIALAVVAVTACGGAGGDGESDPTGPEPAITYHHDVAPILADHCTECHDEGGIAPFALTSFEAIRAVTGPVRDAVSSRTMPPWLAGPGCAEYKDDRSLSDAQIDTLVRWIDAGAPEGTPETGEPRHASEGLSRVDGTLSMASAYTPKESPDEYRCFLLDWPEDETMYVTGFEARPGNPTIVHHVIAYLIPPEQAATYEALDAAEDGPGYTCFGGPGGSPLAPVSWIGGWAPGSAATDFPAGTGIKVVPGSKISLQVHYNLVNGVGEDKTSIAVRLDPKVEKEAGFKFFTNPGWVLGKGMEIPAGDADVEHSYDGDPTLFMSGGKPMLVHSAFLHMHTRGTSGHLDLLRKGSDGGECMLDVPRWNFHWQLPYFFEQPKLVQPGDRIGLHCTWDNSAENQPFVDGRPVPPNDLAWGEGTGDEMCLGAFYVSEP